MEVNERDKAIADSVAEFAKWVEVTGCLNRGSSWYYEAQSLLENAITRGRVSAFKEMALIVPKKSL